MREVYAIAHTSMGSLIARKLFEVVIRVAIEQIKCRIPLNTLQIYVFIYVRAKQTPQNVWGRVLKKEEMVECG